MEWIGWTLAGAMAVTLQVTVVPALCPRFSSPDLVLLFVAVISVHRRGWPPIALSWLMGLLLDLNSLERFGHFALIYFLLALAVALIRPYLTLSRAPMFVVLCFVASLAVGGLNQLYFLLFYPDWPGKWWTGRGNLVAGLLTAGLGFLLIQLMRSFKLREARRVRLPARR